ncbi:MAG TPA: hypothetical protein VIS07_22980 [Candidatus Binatia bacterium]
MNKKHDTLKTIAAAVVALVLALPAAALADSTGNHGKLIGVEHGTPNSLYAAMLRGSIFVDEGNGVVREYGFGGSLCNSRDLTIEEEQLLVVAISQRMSIIPRYRIGGGNTRCLVAFTLTRPAQAAKIQ